MLTGSFISKCVWGAIIPLRSQYSGLPPAAATSVAESMLVGLPGIVTRLGSVASEAQLTWAGIVGLVDASLAESVTSTRLVLALATPPAELSRMTAVVAIAAAPARLSQVRSGRARSECIWDPFLCLRAGAFSIGSPECQVTQHPATNTLAPAKPAARLLHPGEKVRLRLRDGAGIPYSMTTPVFAAIVAVTFMVWYRSDGTLSIHSINTRSVLGSGALE